MVKSADIFTSFDEDLQLSYSIKRNAIKIQHGVEFSKNISLISYEMIVTLATVA